MQKRMTNFENRAKSNMIENVEVYNTSAMSKGICLIANNCHPRIDHLPLKEALQKKGIRVETQYHLPWYRIKLWLKKVLKNEVHSYNFVIFCMLAEGTYGSINDGHGTTVRIGQILSLFQKDKCPLFTNRPRIILIEARQEFPKQIGHTLDMHERPLLEPHMFLGVSTSAGCQSYRGSFKRETRQSILFRALTQALQEHTTFKAVITETYNIALRQRIPVASEFAGTFQKLFYRTTLLYDVYLG